MKASPKQSEVLKMARDKGGDFTKQDAVDLLGHAYYHNEEKYVGEILSNMVKSGFIVRLSPGKFQLSKSRLENLKKGETDVNQKSLFE